MTNKKNSHQSCPASCDLMMLADRLTTMRGLARDISHQIRNPLSSLMLFTDILADTKRFARSAHELDILTEIRDNVRIINDNFTSLLECIGQDQNESLPVDINTVIESLLQFWEPMIKRTGINVDSSLCPDLPPISANRMMLRQALDNLVRNAIEAMDTGGTLTLTTSMERSSLSGRGEMVVIACEDTGTGIADGMKKQIFEPFFSSKPANHGLGLTVARQIVRESGGRLTCSSRAGQTVFRIELPGTTGPARQETAT